MTKVEVVAHSLLDVVCRVQDQLEEPTPQYLVRTPGESAIVLGISKRTTQDQPQ